LSVLWIEDEGASDHKNIAIDWILHEEKLERVKDLSLFYPCSGYDIYTPIEIFSPYITDFWFVDRGYFSSGHQDTAGLGWDIPADRQSPVLSADKRYKFLGRKIKGSPNWDPENKDIEPCVSSETYCHIQSGREIRVHRRRGYGFSAFRNEQSIGKLGVFFYRGDSSGEGGSGNLWLGEDHLEEVFSKLIDGGLLVLDGSDGSPMKREKIGIYSEICKYAWQNTSLTPEELIASMKSVTDGKGRNYHCVGYAGKRYGPTMIWQVYKNAR